MYAPKVIKCVLSHPYLCNILSVNLVYIFFNLPLPTHVWGFLPPATLIDSLLPLLPIHMTSVKDISRMDTFHSLQHIMGMCISTTRICLPLSLIWWWAVPLHSIGVGQGRIEKHLWAAKKVSSICSPAQHPRLPICHIADASAVCKTSLALVDKLSWLLSHLSLLFPSLLYCHPPLLSFSFSLFSHFLIKHTNEFILWKNKKKNYFIFTVVYAILVKYIPVIATCLQLTKSSKLLMPKFN